MILCEKPGASQSWSYLLEEALTKLRAAQRKRRKREGGTDPLAKVQVRGAVLDCSGELPSSTTTVLKKYGRRKASEEVSAAPVIIVNPANGGRTLQLSPRMFTSIVNDTEADESSSSSKYKSKKKKKKKKKAQRMVQVDAAKLARTLDRRIRPQISPLKTPGDLNSQCLQRIGKGATKANGCVVIVQPSSAKLARRHARVIRALSATYRLVPFVTIDASRFVFSAADQLLLAAGAPLSGGTPNASAGGFGEGSLAAPRIVALYPNAVAAAARSKAAQAAAAAKKKQASAKAKAKPGRYRPGGLPLLAAAAAAAAAADDVEAGLSGAQLSESAHLIKRGTQSSEAWRLFRQKRLSARKHFSADGAAALWLDPKRQKRVLVAIDGVLYPWAVGAPYLSAWATLGQRLSGATLDALARQHDEQRRARRGARGGARRSSAKVPPLNAALFDDAAGFNVRTLGDFLAPALGGESGRAAGSSGAGAAPSAAADAVAHLALDAAPTLKLRKKSAAARRKRARTSGGGAGSGGSKASRFKKRMAGEESRSSRRRMGKIGRERERRRKDAELERRAREVEKRQQMEDEMSDIVQAVDEGEGDDAAGCVESDGETCANAGGASDDDEGEEEGEADDDDDDGGADEDDEESEVIDLDGVGDEDDVHDLDREEEEDDDDSDDDDDDDAY